MNNGKVRIYELSRELNLDNKDILSICEGLNIAVKSHSSTITESEAERIRTAAEKYSDRPTATVKSRDSASFEGGSKAHPPKVMGRSNGQQKQQILEIRKPKSRPSSNAPQEGQVVATPPQPPIKPPAPSTPPRQSANINRPLPRTNQPDTQLELVAEPEPEVIQNPATPVEGKPQLVGPPARPEKSKPSLPQVEKPILKRNRQESVGSEPSSLPTPTRSTSPNPPSLSPEAPKESKDKEKRRSQSAHPPVPVLQGPPKRPQPSRGDKEEEAITVKGRLDEADEEETLLEPDELVDAELQLKRPTPPRPVKKKEWEDEEEEGKGASKAGKAVGKVKRRQQEFLDEDDEDFNSDLNDANAPVTVSLSVVRPPKPKSLPGQVASASTQKRRPGPKGGAGETDRDGQRAKSDSRDRRRDKGVPERPETIVLTGSLTVRELADAMAIPETEIIKKLFFKGLAVNITQTLDIPTATMVAE
ncbi:MAG: translation initiation factor IF-2 N-terminal domain-containing protein, partial [Coleofasciculus sp. S288]|nr:translation initiation factor IF-2 N-terminal domain-containing protein [Coleofasciculus sp. S288]